MEAELTDRAAFSVMGIQVRINPMAADYEAIWHQFLPREAEIAPSSSEPVYFGVFSPTDEEGQDDFIAGMAVTAVDAVPGGLVLREIGAAREAVFACTMATIGETWAGSFQDWMPANGYEYDHPRPCYERYVPDPAGGHPSVTIHIPIRPK
jgi:predicted transcriptional regulator YdeE